MTTITTTEQAETLPVGTVLLDAKSLIYVRGFFGDDDLWDRPGRLGGTLADYINLPATVLHVPGQPAPACGGCDGKGAHTRACRTPLLDIAEQVDSLADGLAPALANSGYAIVARIRELATQPAPECDHAVLAAYLASTTALTGSSVQELIAAVMAFSEPQPAPAGVIDREAIARAINPRPWSERFMPFRCHGDDRTTEELVEAERDRVRQTADAVLAVLPGRTVAQAKADAWDEGRQWLAEQMGDVTTDKDENPYRADELEREDKR